MSIDIQSAHLKIVLAILAKYVSEHEIWAFGSRVDGKPKKHSDLDLVIKTDSRLANGIMANLRNAFSESDLPFKVDIVDWSRISDNFKTIILNKYEVVRG